MGKHPGFAAVQKHIEGEGYSKEAAGAILANSSRHASKKAKEKNPRLNRVSHPHEAHHAEAARKHAEAAHEHSKAAHEHSLAALHHASAAGPATKKYDFATNTYK